MAEPTHRLSPPAEAAVRFARRGPGPSLLADPVELTMDAVGMTIIRLGLGLGCSWEAAFEAAAAARAAALAQFERALIAQGAQE